MAEQKRPRLPWSAEWPYWVAGVALAGINTALMAVQGRPWGVTGPITNLGGRLLQGLGLHPEAWAYFKLEQTEAPFQTFDGLNGLLWLNLGVVAGAAISSYFAGEFRIRPLRRKARTLILATGGGLLMGYGTRLSLGCNAGALLGGIPSSSLHGWLFLGAVFLGVWVAIRLFRKVL